jgi:hypothetical protein
MIALFFILATSFLRLSSSDFSMFWLLCFPEIFNSQSIIYGTFVIYVYLLGLLAFRPTLMILVAQRLFLLFCLKILLGLGSTFVFIKIIKLIKLYLIRKLTAVVK